MRVLMLFTLQIFSFYFYTEKTFSSVDNVNLPEGFKIEIFASGLEAPRFMALSPDGVLFVTTLGSGKVMALPDRDEDGKADKVITFVKGLKRPHGIDFHEGYLYVGETHQIARFKYDRFNTAPGEKEIIVPNLPTGGHFTRTMRVGPDGKMYVSVGSSCNVCLEKDERRAAILQFNPDGSDGKIYARGLRNSVGITWHPESKKMWATDNGRDWLGDNLPPEEINIVEEGGNYGWPQCYGNKIPDPEYGSGEFCKRTIPPVFEMQAHSAPLGLAFYTGNMLPQEYRGDLFVVFHGSWNRSVPTGYKVVRVKIEDGKPAGIEDFATGWLRGQKADGRPVDVIVGTDGSLYLSDDRGGMIYRITYGS
ncbi:MAG TPA: sorbosone dehydrogenase family protein [Thermodesulfobacteriota bacterium]|nr:sorbosone dehydrogenase family protein [Thermodesulfobacteriota bacterium]